MQEVKPTINSKIRDYLKDKGISQTWLSTKTGLSIAKINNIVNSRVMISAEDLKTICNVLEVSADLFLN